MDQDPHNVLLDISGVPMGLSLQEKGEKLRCAALKFISGCARYYLELNDPNISWWSRFLVWLIETLSRQLQKQCQNCV